MIEQQYYTRERRGIFRSSEGYDTIAKSRGLNENFIKKNLHPFCFYDPPRKLEASGEKDPLKYPESFICFHVDTGEMVVGRSVYVGADFTGLRSTFFTHNFVIPEAEKGEYIKNIEKTVYAGGFSDSYNIEMGMEIPQLSVIKYDRNERNYNTGQLEDIGITEGVYKKLLHASIMSSMGKKKVYINPGVDIGDISGYAKRLLKYIFAGLPYYVRGNIGYITYVKEPESRKYINIMFVEEEGLRQNYSKIEREYAFDLVNDRIPDIDAVDHPYLDFAWDNINNERNLESFYEFALSMLYNAGHEEKLYMGTYDDLCILYCIKEGNFNLYRSDREHAQDIILKYYNCSDERGKALLSNLYIKIVDREIEDMESSTYLPSYRTVENLASYFNVGVQTVNSRIFYLLGTVLSKSRAVKDYGAGIFKILSQNALMYGQFINLILRSNSVKPVFEIYIEDRFSDIQNLKGLFNEIQYWETISNDVILNRRFKELVTHKVTELLAKSKNMVSENKKIEDFMTGLTKSAGNNLQQEKYREFAVSIIDNCEDFLYENLDLYSLSLEDIKSLRLKYRRSQPRYEMIEYIQELVLKGQSSDRYGIFRLEYGNQVKSIIRKLYKDKIEYSNYPAIILGFITVLGNSIKYDFESLINYLHSGGSDKIYEFFLWSFDENVFSHVINFDEYTESVRNYFITHDKNAFKKKDVKILLYSTRNKEFSKFLKELELELANPAVRFFTIHKRQIMRSMFTFLLLGAVAVGTYKLIGVLLPGEKTDGPLRVKDAYKANIAYKRAMLEDSIKKEIDSLQSKAALDSCMYTIKCGVINIQNMRGLIILSIANTGSNIIGEGPSITDGENYRDIYNFSYSISIAEKDGASIQSPNDLDSLAADLNNAVYAGITKFIDSEITEKEF
ncbi:hypothetical protein OXPF_27550 [Oxobacter pfennigii]|uniref:Uncharacterized protein n=1 Tax=Oxobacter pfennigii TaxID=36849 RepID=A0A0P8WY60_9CLOT|nr:hypothetical protein [Oxobacter pfennigii]KPU43314.1 hypothetical protein OXPF_27550 [Oxobacter pfennigii]